MLTYRAIRRMAANIADSAEADQVEIQAKLKCVASLRDEFKQQNKDLLDLLDELDRKAKDAEKQLKDNYKEWEKTCGFSALRKQILAQAEAIGETEELIGDVENNVMITMRRSKQPSYSAGFSIAMSLLNEVTNNKYASLPDLCKKDIVELSTGVKVLDADIRGFGDEVKDLAKQRGLKISSRTFQADLKSFMRGLASKIKQFFSRSIQHFKSFMSSSPKTVSKLKDYCRAIK